MAKEAGKRTLNRQVERGEGGKRTFETSESRDEAGESVLGKRKRMFFTLCRSGRMRRLNSATGNCLGRILL